ncbi:MAG: TetR/AcrR family transcriptional regulator [Solirubrobacterales bacterium]
MPKSANKTAKTADTEAAQDAARQSTSTRAKLLTAARSAFGELGYVSARVEDIASRAGTSHGTFYNYFEDKADVMVAITEDVAAELYIMENPDAPVSDPPMPVSEIVEIRIGRFLSAYASNWDVVGAWVAAGGAEPRIDAVRSRLRDMFIDSLAAIFKAEQEQQLARPGDPLEYAVAMVAMVEQFAFLWLQRGGSLDDGQARLLAGMWSRAVYPAERLVD